MWQVNLSAKNGRKDDAERRKNESQVHCIQCIVYIQCVNNANKIHIYNENTISGGAQTIQTWKWAIKNEEKM